LVSKSNKILGDCICQNIQGSQYTPSFWLAKDNRVKLIQIDTSKEEKLVHVADLDEQFMKQNKG